MIIADLRQKETRTEDGGNVPFKNGELQLFSRDRVVEAFLGLFRLSAVKTSIAIIVATPPPPHPPPPHLNFELFDAAVTLKCGQGH